MKQISHILSDILAARQRNNPHYSMRAFARDIGLNAGSLSGVLSGRRALPDEVLVSLPKRLAMKPSDVARLRRALSEVGAHRVQSVHDSKRTMVDARHFHILAEWEHFAFLTLMDTKDFRSNEAWLANRLAISISRVRAVKSRLVDAGLIEEGTKGELKKLCNPLNTSEDVTSTALYHGHLEELKLAELALKNRHVLDRDFSSVMVAIPSEKIQEAKSIIRKFRREFAELLENGEGDEVYNLAIQFYPLTQRKTREPNIKGKQCD